MKQYSNQCRLLLTGMLTQILAFGTFMAVAQTDSVQTIYVKSRGLQRVGNTFESTWLIDEQTVMVPLKNVLQFDINHRFGSVENGYSDFLGLYAPSNIRLALSYTPVNNLMVGVGFTKYNMLWDFNIKYALLKQSKERGMPVSVTYYGNMAVDTRPADNFSSNTDRYSFYNQLMVARKVSRDFSVQANVSYSHFNAVEGYISSSGEVKNMMNNGHFAAGVMGRYKVSDAFAFIAGYNQPLTQHPTNNPHPNISFGVEIATPLHAFQVFLGNYQMLVPQYNNMFNQYDYRDGQFLIGFNITRLLDLQEESLKDMMFKRKGKKH